jgi:hypothetical protein
VISDLTQRGGERPQADPLSRSNNVAIGFDIEEDVQSLFLGYVEDFTPTHMQILDVIRRRGQSEAALSKLRDLISRKDVTNPMVLRLEAE